MAYFFSSTSSLIEALPADSAKGSAERGAPDAEVGEGTASAIAEEPNTADGVSQSADLWPKR